MPPTFRYRITLDYPYIMGCFKGEVSNAIQHMQDSDNCYFATDDDGVVRRSPESRHKKATTAVQVVTETKESMNDRLMKALENLVHQLED